MKISFRFTFLTEKQKKNKQKTFAKISSDLQLLLIGNWCINFSRATINRILVKQINEYTKEKVYIAVIRQDLNSDSHLPKKKFICVTESPLKLTKNAFYFIFKALFSLSRFLNFCLDFLVLQKKQLDQKDENNFKFHDFRTWLKTITIQGNQTMKIGQLIENNKRNISL